MSQQCYTMLMMLQCCLCPYSACCDLHAMLCRSHCTAVGLDAVEQQCDAMLDQCLYVPAMLHNADDAAVLLVSILSML